MRLYEQNALRLSKPDKTPGGFRNYQGALDTIAFFYADSDVGFYLHAGPLSQPCFKQLSAFIGMPAGFKQRWEFR